MKKKYYETDKFKDEQKKWYDLLRTGNREIIDTLNLPSEKKKTLRQKIKNMETFNDIEAAVLSQENEVTKQKFTYNHDYVLYFQKCQDLLDGGKIKDKLDKLILEFHIEGKTNVEIEATLPGLKGYKAITRRNIDKRLIKMLENNGITPIEFNI